MNVILLQLLVGLLLVGAALLWLLWRLRDGDHQHHDRLWILPLDEDGPTTDRRAASTPDAESASAARNDFAPSAEVPESPSNSR